MNATAAGRRKVLLISTRFPPDTGPGAIRVGCFAKYLPEFGWSVVALHPEPSALAGSDPGALRAIRIDEDLGVPGYYPEHPVVHRVVTTARWMLKYMARSGGLFPLPFMRAGKRAIDAAVARHRFDAIVASTPDPAALRLADWAARRHGLPWIADFRDILEELLEGPSLQAAIALERRTLRSASRIATVSPGLQRILAGRYALPVDLIYNGFDPDDRVEPRPVPSDRFTIAYTGSFNLRRPPDALLQAIDSAIERGAIDPQRFALQFYGPREHEIAPMRARLRNPAVLESHARKPRQEILKIQAESTLLLMLAEYKVELPGILSAKLFEYLAAGRPILSLPAYEAIDAVLAQTGAGRSCSDAGELSVYLEQAYATWARTGSLPYSGNPAAIEQFSRREQSARLAEALDMAVDGGVGQPSWARTKRPAEMNAS